MEIFKFKKRGCELSKRQEKGRKPQEKMGTWNEKGFRRITWHTGLEN